MPSITPEAGTVESPLAPEVRQALRGGHLRLCATDAHRLALQAKLTEIGVPPSPGDRGALRQLSAMDTDSVDAVLRWLSHAAGVPYGIDGTFLSVEPGLPEPSLMDAPPVAESAHPADRLDPRLITW